MNLYQTIEIVVDCSSAGYLTTRRNDFYSSDKVHLEQFSNSGERYLWVLNGNGSGTFLCLLDGKSEPSEPTVSALHESLAHPLTIAYLLDCHGRNEGVATLQQNDAVYALIQSVDNKFLIMDRD